MGRGAAVSTSLENNPNITFGLANITYPLRASSSTSTSEIINDVVASEMSGYFTRQPKIRGWCFNWARLEIRSMISAPFDRNPMFSLLWPSTTNTNTPQTNTLYML